MVSDMGIVCPTPAPFQVASYLSVDWSNIPSGHVVRLAPNRFSISDPAAMKTIFGHGTAFSKSSFYVPFGEPSRRNLFTEPSNAAHAGMRRHISMLYSTSALVSYEQFINNCNALLVSKFRQFSRATQKVSMRSFLQYYAFDVIGEITVSQLRESMQPRAY